MRLSSAASASRHRGPRGTLTLSAAACLTALAATVLTASGAPAQQQFEDLLVKRYLPRDAAATASVALGDVDQDGDLDLVVGNDLGQQNRLLLNPGTGVFADATHRMPVDTDDTQAVALGDVDGDGDLDLVVGNAGFGQQNRLYLNDGAGAFIDATAGRLPVALHYTRAVALGDVDGDSDLDLVVGNDLDDALYLNDGQGRFTDVTAARMPPVLDQTYAIALEDVDRDGDLDIALGTAINYYMFLFPQNRLYLNDGTGTFADATSGRLPASSSITNALAIEDVDGDGDWDLVLGNGDPWGPAQNSLYLNNGSGTFSDATATHLPPNSDATSALDSNDVDGDGDPDLLVGNAGQNRLYLNDGAGVFADATAQRMPANPDPTWAVALGNVDADPALDLVIGNHGDQNHLYLNDGAGHYADASATRLPVDRDHTNALALGDVDGDGAPDLVFGNFGPARLLLNDGTGAFADATAQRLLASNPIAALVLRDVDADGDRDLLMGANGQSRLYLNDGAGFFADATATHLPAAAHRTAALAMDDVDGDGDPDLVVGNAWQQNRLYLNNGLGIFADVTATRMPVDSDATFALDLGDVDGDGDLDLALGNHSDFGGVYGGQQNRLYLNNGAGVFSDATATQMPVDADYTLALALGNVDGDGDLDLVVGNEGGQTRLYLNDGLGTFADATAARMPVDAEDTQALALGDVDGDADLDLLLGNGRLGWFSGGQQTRLYVNDGQGTFTEATAARMPVDGDFTYALALGDVDGDADLDLVLGNPTLQNRLYLNLHRQLSAPYFPTLSQPYVIELYAKPGYAISTHTAAAVLGFALAPTPLPLPPLGTFYLDPTIAFVLPLVAIPQATGRGVQALPIPATPALLGLALCLQALVVNDADPSEASFTGYTVDAIRG